MSANSYLIVTALGQRFGPADLCQLETWRAEGRVTEGTLLEEVSTGQYFPASEMLSSRAVCPPSFSSRPTKPDPARASAMSAGRRVFFCLLWGGTILVFGWHFIETVLLHQPGFFSDHGGMYVAVGQLANMFPIIDLPITACLGFFLCEAVRGQE